MRYDECMRLRSRAARRGPPRFDLDPLQLGMDRCPWRVGVASLLRIESSDGAARAACRDVLLHWGNPARLRDADIHEVTIKVLPCRHPDRRARSLISFSRSWCGKWETVLDLRHVGPYVLDAMNIFCFDNLVMISKDKTLRRYLCSIPTFPSLATPSSNGSPHTATT